MEEVTFDCSPLSRQLEEREEFSAPSVNYGQDAWRRLKENRFAMTALIIIMCLVGLAAFGPLLYPYDYSFQNLTNASQPPDSVHWFGTDTLGRDLFIRVLYGARISLSIGLVASLINLFIGVIYGGISGLFGGKVDRMMMNIVEVLYGIPSMIYVILLMVFLEPGLINIYIALGISHWLGMARMVRGQMLALKEQEFVLAARTLGANKKRILFRHLLPNALGVIVVNLTLSIPSAIFTEAFLSYIGLGVASPMASWGVLAKDGVVVLRAYPYQLFFPACAISITMLAFNYLGDGLRDALDPRMRR